ncbi:hypothetical protein C8Q80DRAFT_1275137 [Daedaleopsis nitida]|nr:hypothetical protein C8Q80DRAFT_1275137 [Daedaleopsis nitida]
MPVSFVVTPDLEASEWSLDSRRIPTSAHDVLRAASADARARPTNAVHQTSVTDEELHTIVPVSNGFVRTALTAYGRHLNLCVRPDDVWLAILTQLSFYVNAHPEDLRQYFVAHEGQKALTIELSKIPDYARMACQFSQMMHENLADSTLLEWIIPDFTTTTLKDRTICSAVMMATLKSYFTFHGGITCGIPSVTLEGTKADWEEIYRRLSRLEELGPEPAYWADMLRPILRRFIDSFDGRHDLEFWKHCIAYRRQEMCGQDDLDGWITAFCVWSTKGKWNSRWTPDRLLQRRSETHAAHTLSESAGSVMAFSESTASSVRKPGRGVLARQYPGRFKSYTLDGVVYPTINMESIPAGYAEVDIVVDEMTYVMLAGHVAFSVSSKEQGGKLDTVSPSPQWFLGPKNLK